MKMKAIYLQVGDEILLPEWTPEPDEDITYPAEMAKIVSITKRGSKLMLEAYDHEGNDRSLLVHFNAKVKTKF